MPVPSLKEKSEFVLHSSELCRLGYPLHITVLNCFFAEKTLKISTYRIIHYDYSGMQGAQSNFYAWQPSSGLAAVKMLMLEVRLE